MLGQGLVPVSSYQLSSKFIILYHKKINIPLWKDVPGVNVLRISLLSDLKNKMGGVIWFPGSGGYGFPLPGGHLHKKISTIIILDMLLF